MEEGLNERMEQQGAVTSALDGTNVLSLSDEQLVLVAALKHALGSECYRHAFTRSRCLKLCSTGHEYWIDRLYGQGVLLRDNGEAAEGVDESHGDTRRREPAYVLVSLPGVDTADSARLKEHGFTDEEGLEVLWLDYATSECMAYLRTLMERPCHLVMTREDHDQASGTIEAALKRYSIANLWHAIGKVVQDVTALSHKKYFNPRSAAAIVPNALRLHLEQSEATKRPLGKSDRPCVQPLPALGRVFMEVWGLDDNTCGRDVFRLFARICKATTSATTVFDREAISHLLRRVVELDVAAEALGTFAVSILAGDSMDQALRDVATTYRLAALESPPD